MSFTLTVVLIYCRLFNTMACYSDIFKKKYAPEPVVIWRILKGCAEHGAPCEGERAKQSMEIEGWAKQSGLILSRMLARA